MGVVNLTGSLTAKCPILAGLKAWFSVQNLKRHLQDYGLPLGNSLIRASFSNTVGKTYALWTNWELTEFINSIDYILLITKLSILCLL